MLAWSAGQVTAQHGEESQNMRLLAPNDLQARSAYQPIVHKQGSRWIAYVGHHGGEAFNPLTGVVERNGTSVVDVTDPGLPVYLKHIPGPPGVGEAGGAQMVRACNGSDLPKGDPAKVYLLRATANSHEVYDTTDPANPSLVRTVVGNLGGTHKNWWECDTGIAYLVSDGRTLEDANPPSPNWRTDRMTQIFDLSDPANPVFLRNYGLVGQEPGSTGPVPTGVHGPISLGPAGNRVYFGHGTGSNGILQIVDREKLLTGPFNPTEPTPEDLLAPQIGRLDTSPSMGAHTVFPVLGMDVFPKNAQGRFRDIIVLVNEAGGNNADNVCPGNRQLVYMVDVTIASGSESKPMGVANFQVPEASGNFCDRGGRFGSHASHESFTEIYYKKIMFFSWFNAGVRAVDIRDPWSPKEVGFFIPATTKNTDPRDGQIAIQTNNVEVDDRGFIYIVDRANTGLHILELTGEARKIANLP
ncbi:hypothetical protein EPO44_09430 [bacterium]|nr:MAG: hypothetical protein EPO44_09430 [bacterium]